MMMMMMMMTEISTSVFIMSGKFIVTLFVFFQNPKQISVVTN